MHRAADCHYGGEFAAAFYRHNQASGTRGAQVCPTRGYRAIYGDDHLRARAAVASSPSVDIKTKLRALSGAALILERDFELDAIGQRLTFLDVNVLFDDTPHAQVAQAVLRHRDRGVGRLFPRLRARANECYNLVDAFCHVLLPSPGACLTHCTR